MRVFPTHRGCGLTATVQYVRALYCYIYIAYRYSRSRDVVRPPGGVSGWEEWGGEWSVELDDEIWGVREKEIKKQ